MWKKEIIQSWIIHIAEKFSHLLDDVFLFLKI